MDEQYQQMALNIAAKVREKYPRGHNKDRCFDACSDLVEAMENMPFDCSIQFGWFNGHTHSWVEVWKDSPPTILDVTADQFGDFPEIIWGSPEDWTQYEYDTGESKCRQ